MERRPPPNGQPPQPRRARSQRRLQGLIGLAILVLMASNLGLPLSGGYVAVDVLLVTIGFDVARSIERGTDRHWLKQFWLCTLGRIAAPLAVALAMVALYWSWHDQLDEPKIRAILGAVTMTPNFFTIFGGADFPAISHLWVVGIVMQFTLLAPVLVAGFRRSLRPDRRASALLGVAAGLALSRLGFLILGIAEPASVATNTLTRLDGLLVGVAIGLAPTAVLRRRTPVAFASPAFAGLMLLFALGVDRADMPAAAIGIMVPLAVGLTGLIVAAEAIGGQQQALSATLDNLALRWLGERAVGIYIWHYLFGFAIDRDGLGSAGDLGAGSDPGQWPGFSLFVVRIVFSLAAGAASYRFLELPALDAVARLMRRSAEREAADQGPTDDADPRSDGVLVAPSLLTSSKWGSTSGMAEAGS